MIETSKDGNIVYYQDILWNWELVIGFILLFTIIFTIPAILLLQRGFHPKPICKIGKRYIEWDDIKVAFKDIFSFHIKTSFPFRYPGRRPTGMNKFLVFKLKGKKELYSSIHISQLSEQEQEHLVQTLRKRGLKQTDNKSMINTLPISTNAWQKIQEEYHKTDL